MSRQRTEIWILGALLVVAGVALYRSARRGAPAASSGGVSAVKFVPLNVQEPQLRMDLLEQLQKSQYTGTHRDVFRAAAAPIAPTRMAAHRDTFVPQGPQPPAPPPPPPPLSVPAEYFGRASMAGTQKPVAFLMSGDSVLVVPEGDTFLNRFRLLRVDDRSIYVEEISSGRHTTMPIIPPPSGESSD